MTYVKSEHLRNLYTFIPFSSTVSAFQSALIAAFPGFNIQCVADTTSGQTSNAVVVINDSVVMTVPPGSFVGYNLGLWQQFPAAQMAGGINSLYTQYP